MATADAVRPGPDEAALLARFGLDAGDFLGAGGEFRVFAVDERRVLRIFHPGDDPRTGAVDGLLASWASAGVDVPVPVVLDAGRQGRQDWTVDRRLPGRSLGEHLAVAPEGGRREMLTSTSVTVRRLRDLPVPCPGFRQVCVPGAPSHPRLVDLLDDRMDAGIALGGGALACRVPDLDAQRARMRELLAGRLVEPQFVHADICPGNVMADGHACTGVIDLSVHALAADPVMDEVGLVCMLGRYPGSEDDEAWLEGVLREQLGEDAWLVDVYRRFYGAYYSMDPATLPWSVEQFARPWR